MTRFVAATALFESKYTEQGGSVHEKANNLSREANRIIEDTLFIYEPEFRAYDLQEPPPGAGTGDVSILSYPVS